MSRHLLRLFPNADEEQASTQRDAEGPDPADCRFVWGGAAVHG